MDHNYLCNLIVPGAAKSGTSTLHELLNLHPNISMSREKEPHHFSRARHFNLGAKSHNALFEECDGIEFFGESSTSYLPSPETAYRVKAALSDPKIIMVLRAPVERTLSHYRWRYRLGLERRPLIRALKESGRGYDPESPSEYGYEAYLDFSNYSKHCENWLNVFGNENVLLLNSEELRIKKQDALAKCFSFLGLPRHVLTETPSDANTTNSLRRRSPKFATKIATLIPNNLKSSRLYRGVRKNALTLATVSPPSELNSEERRFLREALAEDVDWFELKFSENANE